MTTIVLSADDAYLPYVACNLAQLARYGRRADGVVLSVPEVVDDVILAGVEVAADMHGIDLSVVRVPEPADLSARRVVYDDICPAFVFSKLLLAEILPTLDDVLYLDVDTLIRAPLDDLLEWELRHSLGGVIEVAGTGRHIFGTSRQPYFNAGVLRMSLERMRQEQTWEHAQLILERRGELVLQEQDVLNLLFRNRFDQLPLVFNVFESVLLENPALAGLQDPVIVHFTGATKPWHKSSKSSYAREWRRLYSAALPADHAPMPKAQPHSLPLSNRRIVYAYARESGRGRLSSLARATVPSTVKTSIKVTANKGLDLAGSRLDSLRTAFQPNGWQSRKLPKVNVPPHPGRRSDPQGLDLLISVPRSGTNALGDAIERSRPNVHWLCDLYWGTPFGLRDGELSERYPWFATGAPEFRDNLSPAENAASGRRFAAAMNAHALEITKAVVDSRDGRVLIKVFPDQLHHSVFEELLTVFRPRLLIARRDMLFSYVSILRATRSNRWRNDDLTDVPFSVKDADALQYALRCDLWIDRVARLAVKHELDTVWLTYAGLFTTGTDIPLLESFYPGAPLPVDDQSSGLRSGLKVQDRRSDASVLAIVKAVSGLSAAAQKQLLRLPGHHVTFE